MTAYSRLILTNNVFDNRWVHENDPEVVAERFKGIVGDITALEG